MLNQVKEKCLDIEALAPRTKGSVIYKMLYNDYGIIFYLKHIFYELTAPSYANHPELVMTMRNAEDHKYPLGKEWGDMTIQIKKALAKTTLVDIQYSPEVAESEHSQQPESSQHGAQFQRVLRPCEG